MFKIPKKTLEDLEFHQVLRQVSDYAITPMGKEACFDLFPSIEVVFIQTELQAVFEFLASFDNENRIPNHGFQSVTSFLSLLKIENSVLEPAAFKTFAANTETVNTLLTFLLKFKTYYPTLFGASEHLVQEKEIKKAVDQVIDRFGEIRDYASDALFSIRKQIHQIRGKIGNSFNKALSSYQSSNYLDDIRESVVDNKRVLAVKAMYRRKVKGAILGSSKTGSIVFIEPEATNALTRELQNLQYEETQEIKKILSELTDFFRPFLPLLQSQQDFLLYLDTVYARARYAASINAQLPRIVLDTQEIDYINAYHPLLLKTHQLEGKTTFPQDITLDKEHRIVVISGPNAGGKSITLKTVGLLQLMLQSGMLIPVHERSVGCIFDRILTDIGDNQSIENHLSTYSYRLKNMKVFLKKCNAQTLFLIDEFGTGSDPELGGALAEVILEDFYEREAFGLITTHYANLKVLANELPAMVNANMQFDNRTLEPVFKLITGEAGSSFTFEVAQKNGLPYSLINRAKKKIERGKVRFDETIAKLQKERSKMAKTGASLKEKEDQAAKASENMESLNAKLKSKLISYQELFDYNQRMIALGNKFNEVAENYFLNNKKRPLIAELLRLVETENAKRKRKTATEAKKERAQKDKLNTVVEKEIAVVRKEKKKQKKEPKTEITPKRTLKIGDRVRMHDGRSVGSIDAIEKRKAIVNYGKFTTQINLDLLEFVEAEKK